MNEPPPNPVETARPAIAQDIFCQRCGYNLRGLTGNRCPECGGSLEGVRSLTPQIPWMYRKETGWFRAYWRTVWFVMVRQSQFCDEMARPVSFADSQKFRWVTVGIVYLPVFLAGLAFVLTNAQSPSTNDFFVFVWCNPWYASLWHASVVLFLAAITGVPGYFFHPKDIPVQQQNRAIALSYYASGPLVFLGIPILTCAAAVLTSRLSERTSMVFLVLSLTLPIAAIAPWWLDLIHLARRLVPQKPSHAATVAMSVPFLWFLLALVFLAGIPLIVLGVFLAFASLN